jgi:invasion protein IalB
MFGPELGTVFLPNGFVVKRGVDVTWRMTGTKCLVLADCDLTEQQSKDALQAMLSGTEMEFSFVDKYLRRFDLSWPLDGFSDAFETYQKQWSLRQ